MAGLVRTYLINFNERIHIMTRMKKAIRSLSLAMAVALSSAMFTGVFAAPVTVDLSASRQTIRGFGGMNHPQWIGDLTQAQRETAFGNGPNQLGMSVVRIYICSNPNNWNREVATAKYASDNGVLVFASPWHQPADMIRRGQSRYNSNTEWNNTRIIRTDRFAQYVEHLNAFVERMISSGVNLHSISIQNEHDYGYHGDWTEWTGEEILEFMKNHAGNIDRRVKVITPEPFQYRKNELNLILNDSVALANTDIFATHLYGTSPSNMAYPLFKEKGAGKELWMTEVYHPNSSSDANLWPEALEVARHIHRAMVDGEFQMYVWWYIRRFYGPILDDGSISKRGWMMAHFSKFVRPGYVRVNATPAIPVAQTSNAGHGQGGVFVSAYRGVQDGRAVIVAINMGASAANLDFTINGGSVSTMEAYRTSENQNMAKLADIGVSGNRFSASLPARSVTTFTGTTGTTSVKSAHVSAIARPTVTVRGRTLNVHAPAGSEVTVRVIDMRGKTAAKFSVAGESRLSLDRIPAGAYIIEAHRMNGGVSREVAVLR